MDEYEGKTPLEALIDALNEHDVEYVAIGENNSLIAKDAAGDPHECWNGVDKVNVCVPMSVEDTVSYLRSPFRCCDCSETGMQKDENTRLKAENAELRGLVCDLIDDWMHQVCPTFAYCSRDGDYKGCKDERCGNLIYVQTARDLGIEVNND